MTVPRTPEIVKRSLQLTASSLAALLLAGCMVGPDFEKPVADVNPAWEERSRERFAEAVEMIRSEQINPVTWWQSFGDPTLIRLLELATSQNLDLQSAAVRVYQARAQLGISDAGLLPTVGAAGQGTSSDSATLYQLGVQANWELDFWGKFRRGIESSLAGYNATIASYYAADVSLASTVASTYINLRNTEELIRVARQNLALQGESLRIADARYQAGSTSLLALSQARARYQQTLAQLPRLNGQKEQLQNALSVLLGKPPGYFQGLFDKEQKREQMTTPKALNVGIPRDLLRRRPDVLVAEYQAASQSALIGVQQAQLYPSFSLNGMFSYLNASVSYQGGSTFKFDGSNLSGGAAFYFPLFYRGALVDQVRVQDASFQQAVLNYQNVVLQAQAEVENALVQIATSLSSTEDLARALAASREAARLAVDLYESGQSDYNTVIVAQQTLLSVQSDYVQSKTDTLLGYVQAFKALGGGWADDMRVPALPNEMIAQMSQRTDWGEALSQPDTPHLVQTPGLKP
ncbi:efflux transporter outer membrane subunit [Orrella marina]|uniref:Transporter n=1 Tax=Orrella marina TaxID=2163011 RepID=A0A2R4XGQ7_9BURK|nr:TolC family protein [Orrella marina]AWB32899.1 transporter [Orrella marina]